MSLPAFGASNASQIFLVPKTISNLNASVIATGDFNGDGLPDLAVGTIHELTILLGKSGGGFTQGAQYTLSYGPAFIAVADLNGDGRPDLVTVDGRTGASVWRGNGDGTFQSAVNYNVPKGAFAIAVGDFNGDGKPDLVIPAQTSYAPGSVSLLLNKGDGTFRQPMNVGGTLAPASVSAGDFNHDGKLDLAVGDSFGVNVLLGNGDGTFQNPTYYQIGVNVDSHSIAIADLNGDGYLDLAVANHFGQDTVGFGSVSILLGNGDGTFRPPANYTNLSEPDVVTAIDLNHNGKVDLVTAGANGIGIMMGHGDGSFATTYYYFGYFPLAVADFNGDGNIDLVAGESSGVGLYLGNGDGTFQANRSFLARTSTLSPGGTVIGDFNGDGKLDVATVGGVGLEVTLGNGDGTFGAPIGTPIKAIPFITAIATGDFNGDRKLDLAAVILDGGLDILLGNGDGTFQQPVYYPAPPSSFVVVADVNHDGKLDIVSPGGTSVNVWLGIGDGTFEAYQTFIADSPYWLALADFNNDGNLDVVTSSTNVLLGNGNGTFQSPKDYGTDALGVIAGDFNGDGKTDFLIPGSQFLGFFVDMYLGNGDGTFKGPLTSPTNVAGGPMVAADFNNDGKLDVAMATVANGGAGFYAMNLLLGNGDGTFQPAGSYLPGPVGSSIAVGDFNHDGAPDLVLTEPPGFTVLLNVRGTTASITSSQNPSKVGQAVTFTTAVQPTVVGAAEVAGPITGSVSFLDGTALLGSGNVSQGRASISTLSLSSGSHTITGKYSGSGNYNPAISAPLVQTVNP